MSNKWSAVLCVLFLGWATNVKAAESVNAHFRETISSNDVILIGEQHQRTDSINLFQSLVDSQLGNKKCLAVALVIASDQQLVLDKIMQGKATVEDLHISSIVDHQAFRLMISHFAEQKQQGACIAVLAIDAGEDVVEPRDEWMLKQLRKVAGRQPLFVLLGNLHTLKAVDWDLDMVSEPHPYLAKLLATYGYRVKSYPQVWSNGQCTLSKASIATDPVEIINAVNQHLIVLLNAFTFQPTEKVVDGVIDWGCEK